MKGLLGRIGKEWGREAAHPSGMSLGQIVTAPVGLGAVGGAALGAPAALLGASEGPESAMNWGAHAGAFGATGMGALGAVAAGTMGLKQLVTAIARAMKQKMPQASDNEIIMNAQRVVQDAMSRPDARAQLEKILGPMNWPPGPGGPQ